MLRSHKVRLDPTHAQAQHFAHACGVARFAWNWALAEWQRQYEASKLDPALPRPTEGALRRQLNAIKREQYPWMLEVTKCAPQEAIINLGRAYKNWFDALSGRRKGPKAQAPRFKRKGERDRFKIHGTVTAIDDSRIRIPNLGWVRMRESLRFSGRVVSVTVSRTAHAWFAAVTVDAEDVPARCESQAAVGVDVGVHTLAVFSDASPPVEGPKALKTLLQRLRRLSRAHSRKAKASANRKKSAQRLARLHWRIACMRADALHKPTNRLTRDYAWVAIEDLNVCGMLGNSRLARHLADASFGEFRRQLTYKAAMREGTLVVVGRGYPSSKTCSGCGAVNTARTLSARHWTCTICGVTHDRDKNAARNFLARAFVSMNPNTRPVWACRPVERKALTGGLSGPRESVLEEGR